MNSFLGLGQEHLQSYVDKTGNKVFLHLRKIKHVIPQDKTEQEPEKKITRLAIGVESGFQLDSAKFEYEEKHSIVIFPGPVEFPLPIADLPIQVL